MISFDILLNAFVTLFVTIDPIGNAPLFLGLTVGLEAARRRRIAIRGTVIAFGVLTLFALTGTAALAQDTLPQHVIHHAAFGVE